MTNYKKKKRSRNGNVLKCPYCGAKVVYKSADGIYRENKKGIMLYVCSNFPECDAYVRADMNTGRPIGSLANQKLRTMRVTAHRSFDLLHQSGLMTKNEAYQWLAFLISAPLSQAHIGFLGEHYCGLVIDESRKLFEQRMLKKCARQNN